MKTLLFIALVILALSSARALTAISSTRTSVTLQWSAPIDGCDGRATEYDIRYSRQPITRANWSQAIRITTPAPAVPGATEILVVSGLEPGVVYFFAGMASDKRPNWSGLSMVVSRSTLSGPSGPPAVVGDLQ